MYSSPVLRFGSKTVAGVLDWQADSGELTVGLPDVSFPLSVAFDVGVDLPGKAVAGGKKGFGIDFSFGGKGKGKGGDGETEDDDAKKSLSHKVSIRTVRYSS